MDTFDNLYTDSEFNEAIGLLLNDFIQKKYKKSSRTIEFDILRSAGWTASILAESTIEKHREKAQLFAFLIHLYGNGDVEYDRLSYVILSRTGNLLSAKFLKTLFDDDFVTHNFDFGESLNHELLLERLKRAIINEDKILLTTQFQLDLWNKLQAIDNVSISAPTSAGKSFIIQNYFSQRYHKENSISGLYLVPTKALINQASEDLRKLLPSTDIRTTFIEEEHILNAEGHAYPKREFQNKVMYVLTPERCLKLIQNAKKVDLYPNVIFVDEIQNIEDIHGRGILFEFVLEKLSLLFPKAKTITAGPFIKNSSEIFNELFNLNDIKCDTFLSPVMQLRAIVRNTTEDNVLEIAIKEPSIEQTHSVSLDVSFNLNYELNKNKGVGFAKIVNELSQDGQSIVYCSQTNYVEKWVLRLEQILPKVEVSQKVIDLISFLKEEIHSKYYLIKCLKKGIAFHHSKLPDIVRKEIEDLFKSGDIKVLYCTSTLLQGVNLPANNLFVTAPKKRLEPLSSFEFGNLIGRAGRINDSLYGTIFCIETNDEEKLWAENYYKKGFEKEIITASKRMLNKTEDIIAGLTEGSNEEGISHTLTNLRQKYLLSPQNLESYLKRKCKSESYVNQVLIGIKNNLEFVSIPAELANLNPTIDPILQDKLYKRIKEDGISKWVITPNSNFYKRIGKDYLSNYEFENLSFFWQLAILCENLDEIFNISSEAYYKQDISLSIRSIAYFGFRWMQNNSLKDIILDDIKFYSEILERIDANDERDINLRINNVINIHTKVVTFLLVKYVKLLADIVESMLGEDELEKYKFTLSLPIMIELGTTEPIVIQMITAGISRSVALRVSKLFKKVKGHMEMDVMKWIENEQNLTELPQIFINYLRKNKYIKEV